MNDQITKKNVLCIAEWTTSRGRKGRSGKKHHLSDEVIAACIAQRISGTSLLRKLKLRLRFKLGLLFNLDHPFSRAGYKPTSQKEEGAA